jgi:hypothetical protein
MNHQDEPRRLVLIGIHKKGDKGFKKRFDYKAKLNQINDVDDLLLVPDQAHSSSSRIMNLLSD